MKRRHIAALSILGGVAAIGLCWRLAALTKAAGFEEQSSHGNLIAFTLNFAKPGRQSNQNDSLVIMPLLEHA